MKYKVGDRVRIKDDLDIRLIGEAEIIKFSGKIMTIQTVELDEFSYVYTMQEDGGKYYWFEAWIEGLAEPEQKKLTMTEILQMAIDTYGEDEQCRMIQEEMDGLGVALSKWHRKPSEDTLAQVQEEIADVRIMIEQASMMFGEADVAAAAERKIRRLHDRMKDEQTVEVVTGKRSINGKTCAWINPDKVKVEIGSIVIADTEKGHMPIIVTNTWPEKFKDVKHHRKIICSGGLSDE